MTFVTGLIVGLIIGWVIEWVVDMVFWRRDDSLLQRQLNESQEKIKRLEAELAEMSAATAPQTEQPAYHEKDKFEQIHGIGPVFAKRLNRAGIFTFAELAAQTPESIEAIIEPEEWQKIEPAAWIAEARQIAREASQA